MSEVREPRCSDCEQPLDKFSRLVDAVLRTRHQTMLTAEQLWLGAFTLTCATLLLYSGAQSLLADGRTTYCYVRAASHGTTAIIFLMSAF